MIIINSIGDAQKLNKGDQYIIGFDFQNPINMNIKKIEQIQSAIEKEFDSTKEKTKKV